MKTGVQSFLLLAVAILLVKSQTSPVLSYEDAITSQPLFANRDAEGRTFRPIIEKLQVSTLNPSSMDPSAVTMKELRFVALETLCSEGQEKQDKPCPLKQNGQVLLCNLVISHPVQDINIVDVSKMACRLMEKEEALKEKVRTRRSQSSNGFRGSKSSKGGGKSRPGGGSTIASINNRGNGGTLTA